MMGVSKVDIGPLRALRSRVPPTFRTLRPQKASLRAPCGACHEVYLPLLCKHTWEKTYDTNIIISLF